MVRHTRRYFYFMDRKEVYERSHLYRIDVQTYDKLITIHHLDSISIEEIHQYSFLSYV